MHELNSFVRRELKWITYISFCLVFCAWLINGNCINNYFQNQSNCNLTLPFSNATTLLPLHGASCNATIYLPNGTVDGNYEMLENQSMGVYYFNHSYTNYLNLINYSANMTCNLTEQINYSYQPFYVVNDSTSHLIVPITNPVGKGIDLLLTLYLLSLTVILVIFAYRERDLLLLLFAFLIDFITATYVFEGIYFVVADNANLNFVYLSDFYTQSIGLTLVLLAFFLLLKIILLVAEYLTQKGASK